MKGFADFEFFGGFEGPAHFLDAEQQGEAGIEAAGDCGIAAPVLASKDGGGPLAGTEAIKGLAAVIAQFFAALVNGAAEVGRQVMAGLTGGLIVGELGAAGKGERDAAQGKALIALRCEVGFHRRGLGFRLFDTTKPRFFWNRGFMCFGCKEMSVFGRPCSDLLSQVLRLSTIGAEGFDGRVRDGIGSWAPRKNHKVGEKHVS